MATLEVGTLVSFFTCGKKRPGVVVKVGPRQAHVQWTAPSSGVTRVKAVPIASCTTPNGEKFDNEVAPKRVRCSADTIHKTWQPDGFLRWARAKQCLREGKVSGRCAEHLLVDNKAVREEVKLLQERVNARLHERWVADHVTRFTAENCPVVAGRCEVHHKVPYPEFCRHPEKCAGRGSCPRDISCAD